MNIKNFITISIAFIMLNLYQPIFSMECDSSEPMINRNKDLSYLITQLPVEITHLILKNVFMNPDIIKRETNIYKGFDNIKKYLAAAYKNLPLPCHSFNEFKENLAPQIICFYRQLLIEHFLEIRGTGLYPKKHDWEKYEYLNLKIANLLLLIINHETENDRALLYLIGRGDFIFYRSELIKIFLFFGANSNAIEKNIQKCSVLMLFSKSLYPSLKIAKLLLHYKADPNLGNINGHTPLAEVVSHGNKAFSKLLLQFNANPDSKDNAGRTPLFWACQNGYFRIAKLLLKYGANPNTQTNLQRIISSKGEIGFHTPLSIAQSQGYTEIVNLLEEYNKCCFTPKFCVIS